MEESDRWAGALEGEVSPCPRYKHSWRGHLMEGPWYIMWCNNCGSLVLKNLSGER